MDLKEADNIDLDEKKEKERRNRGESIKRETKRNGGALESTHPSTAELSCDWRQSWGWSLSPVP
jgi:hypothetical protein